MEDNHFSGIIPISFGKLVTLQLLTLHRNDLFGEILESLGNLTRLYALTLSKNNLKGNAIIQYLDLSRNNLSGNIPEKLEQLPFLQYLNLSSNNPEGEVPTRRVFKNASANSLVGNTNLCGGIPELQLSACPIVQKKNRSPVIIILATTISSIVLFMIVLSIMFCIEKKKNSSSMPFTVDGLLRISYQELLQATGGFCSDNLIGQVVLAQCLNEVLISREEKLVFVKVLNLEQHGVVKSFVAECKALKNICHRNLVKFLTYCSSIDFKSNDFKAVVFDFMTNGSLEMWLHPERDGNSQSRNLNLLQRLHIAIDVSSALHYLHNNCETPIIHCDLKPSNILLDNDMTAHVGRKPTDELFTDGLNLHNFVRANLPGRVMQVVDPCLSQHENLGRQQQSIEDNDNYNAQAEIGDNNVNIENLTVEGGISPGNRTVMFIRTARRSDEYERCHKKTKCRH
ncbi:receptor-kinase, putative [Ricinus communis]|uniref:Receptor-kinase, putative n=1 Tax=Ricinus communis TaxID=3988 RepID=B9SLK5_RICCO|nr:receptor-kinase, putative [Ricinus communis]